MVLLETTTVLGATLGEILKVINLNALVLVLGVGVCLYFVWGKIGETIVYAYPCTRVRAIKGKLMERENLRNLASMKSVEEISKRLVDTVYGKEVKELSIKYSGVELVEHAVNKNTADSFRTILRFLPKKKVKLFSAILLKWDMENIKVLLRGAHYKLDPSEIESYLHEAGQLSFKDMKKCIGVPVNTIAKKLYSHPIGCVLSGYVEEYSRTKNLGVLESALNKQYFGLVIEANKKAGLDKKIVKEIFDLIIDTQDIILILRMKRVNEKIDLIKDKLVIKKWAKLAKAGTYEAALERLKETKYRPLVEKSGGSLGHLEHEFEKAILRKGVKMTCTNPLSAAPILGYIFSKMSEGRNIELIANFKAAGKSDHEIMEELV